MRYTPSILTILAFMLAALAIGSSAHAQQGAAALDDAGRRAAVEAAARILRNRYIFPDVGEQAARAIESALEAGKYDDLDVRATFAERLTEDMRAVAHDKHLRVTRADIIGGNVGYIEIVGFPPPFQFNGPTDRAMAALKDTRALIVDVRRNGGGSPESVTRLVSYFLNGGERVHINTFINRTPDTTTFTTREFWSEPTPFSYTRKPVYVLTSGFTFSGGEEFAYDMQTLKLAELVGDTTGGGANPGGMMPVAAGLAMFVPGGRAENPVTGKNWEGVGVVPGIAVRSADALRVALEKLGVSPALADIDAASASRVFEPAPLRTERQPGAEAAITRMSGELARGEPNYEMLSPQLGQATRTQLPNLTNRFSSLGAIKSVTFVEVTPNGLDVYDVEYASGAMRWLIVLDADGKTASANLQPLR